MTDRPQAQPDTLPPPPGEDDVYSAETRVDPLPKELLELMRSSREAAKPKAEAGASSNLKTPVVPPPPPVPRPSRPGMAAAKAPPASKPTPPKAEAAAPPRGDHDFVDFGYTEESTEPTLDKPIRYINKAREMAGLEALKEPVKEVAAPVSAPQPAAEEPALPAPLPEGDDKPSAEELGTRRGIPFPALLLLVVIVAALAAWLVSSLMKSS